MTAAKTGAKTAAKSPAKSGAKTAASPSLRRDLLAVLSGDGPFSGVNAETLARLVEASRISRVAAGRIIFRKGDAPGSCYLILSGAVKVSLPSTDGRETVLAILGRGDVVGEMALLDRQPRSATVTALKTCELCQLTTAAFEWLARTDIAIYRQLLCVLSARLRAGNESSVLQQMPLGARLARALLQLAQSFGERLPEGRVLIRQKLSQAELGRMVGAARESVNRQLNDWRSAQLLTLISGYCCLERPDAFDKIAGCEPRTGDTGFRRCRQAPG